MVNRARRQFVAVIMGILLIVFFCMGAAIILTAETTQKEKIKNMLNPFDTTAKFNGYRRFVLGCSWSGTFVVDANAGNLFTADEIENIFRFIYERENFSVYLENPPAHGTKAGGIRRLLLSHQFCGRRLSDLRNRRLSRAGAHRPGDFEHGALQPHRARRSVRHRLFPLLLDRQAHRRSAQKAAAVHLGRQPRTENPLTIISANTDILQNDYGEVQWLSNIRQQTARMNAMVGEMLNLAKLQEDAPW